MVGIGSCGYGGQKPHNLLSANWRARNTIGIVQSRSEGSRTRGLLSKSQSSKALEPEALISKGKKRCSVQEGKQRICPSFAFLFYSGPQKTDRVMPTYIGKGGSLHAVY